MKVLTDAVKKILQRLKANQKNLSFLLLIGKTRHGKSALLRQSTLEHLTIDAEQAFDIYYNQDGIILELNESWLHESQTLLEHALKQLNHILHINGLLLAIDINDLFADDPTELAKKTLEHAKLLQRFAKALGYLVETAFVFTKLDSLAGFSDFFQQDKRLDNQTPLGFSLDWGRKANQIANNYHARFDHLLESLSQDVLQKIHPARSSLKRMLIREFPLQLANFHLPIQTLIKQISPKHCKISAVYFTSAEQGGTSQDHLNQKICREYALMLPDQVPQSSNYRAYFIDEALHAFQAQTLHPLPRLVLPQKYIIRAAALLMGLSLTFVIQHHMASSRVLDQVTKELLAYDTENKNSAASGQALFHLTEASEAIQQIKAHHGTSPALQNLHSTLKSTTEQKLQHTFLPSTLGLVERTLENPEQPPAARYHALKTYIALGTPDKRTNDDVIQWFENAWTQTSPSQDISNQTALLKKILHDPKQSIPINQQLVRDNRNYLNALPAGYLYYALLKNTFPKETQPLHWSGFIPGAKALPVCFTKQGFQTLSANIPEYASQFQQENWVLARQDLKNLSSLLEQAYAYDYLTWWRQLIKRTHLTPAENYTDARGRLDTLDKADTLRDITRFIQAQTRPDLDHERSVFNQIIASEFTALNLLSEATLRDLAFDIRELKQFLSTLSVTQDNGRSAFMLTRAHFATDAPARDALSALYLTTKQLPAPIDLWSKQLADDAWFLLMSDAKQFINTEWQQQIYPQYQRAIHNRYPFKNKAKDDVALADFDRFFATHGLLNQFITDNIKPFLNTADANWSLKEVHGHVMPISEQTIQQLMRANIITAMFFPLHRESSQIQFSLQKMNLDPVIEALELSIGDTQLRDTQSHESITNFNWPQSNAELILHSIEGKAYTLNESGPWAFFKLLGKLNILMDKKDSASLHVLFEINGDSGRYLLKTANQVNPFTPGILNEFDLNDSIV